MSTHTYKRSWSNSADLTNFYSFVECFGDNDDSMVAILQMATMYRIVCSSEN